MKKIAIRGGIILAIVLGCCLFFANTIQTVTTPKVKFIQVSNKKFEDKMQMEGSLYFAKTEKVTFEDARRAPVTVEKMYVRVGDPVKTGDIIATTKLSGSFEDEVEAATAALNDARKAHSENEVANIKFVDNTDTDKNEAFRQVETTQETLANAQADLLGAAAKKGLILSEEEAKWAAEVQKTGDNELVELMNAVLDAQQRADQAQDRLIEVYKDSKTKEDLVAFLAKRSQLVTAMKKATAKLRDLVTKGNALTEIRAKHDGYIVALSLKEGATYDGSAPAYELTLEEAPPVLRCDITQARQTLTAGMRADLAGGERGDIKTEIADIVREGVDKKYAVITLTDEIVTQLGGIRSLLDRSVSVKITYRAKNNTSVLPKDVLLDSSKTKKGDKNAVYIAEEQWGNMLTGQQIIARKMEVTIEEWGESEVAIREDLRNMRLIYNRDRDFNDGSRVMEYQN